MHFRTVLHDEGPGQGTGLGLSLCHCIVERHRGSIWVDNEPGGGAKFVIELPIEARGGSDRANQPAAPDPVIRGKTILIVDDEAEIGDVLEQMLEAEGHNVDSAANGAIALERLGERAYDLIISDLRMPRWMVRRCTWRSSGGIWRFAATSSSSRATRSIPSWSSSPQTGTPTLGKPCAAADVRRVVHRAFSRP